MKALGLVVSEKNIFLCFPIVNLWELPVAMETTILIQSALKPNAINHTYPVIVHIKFDQEWSTRYFSLKL